MNFLPTEGVTSVSFCAAKRFLGEAEAGLEKTSKLGCFGGIRFRDSCFTILRVNPVPLRS